MTRAHGLLTIEVPSRRPPPGRSGVVDSDVDSEVVTAAQRGDERALSTLVEQHLPLVYNFIGRALNGGPDVDDVVQETMLRVVQDLPTLREPSRFRGWLIAVAQNQVQERFRLGYRAARRQTSLELVTELGDPGLDFVSVTILRLQLAGQRREVAEATRWLSPEDQTLLGLWWQEASGSITREELAEGLGVNPAYAAVRIQRMQARLQTARIVQRAADSNDGCPTLKSIASRRGGEAHPRLLAPLARHVAGCARCRDTEAQLLPARGLLSGLPLVPVPLLLADRIPDLATALSQGWTPLLQTGGSHASLWAWKPMVFVKTMGGVGIATSTALAISVALYLQPAPPAPPAPPASTTRTTLPAPSPAARPSMAPVPSRAASLPTAVRTPARLGQDAGILSADWYVSPTGDDAGPGTLAAPFATLGQAATVVRPGQTIALRGGTYRWSEQIRLETDGLVGERIVLTNFGREIPVIDAAGSGQASFIWHEADYWTVQGLEIRNAGGISYDCRACRGNIFRRMVIHDGAGIGLRLTEDGTVDNEILDSDLFANHDDKGRADGLAIRDGSGGGNVVRGCRFFNNAGDGVRLSRFGGAVTIENSWAYGNGVNRWGLGDFTGLGNGFSLGGGENSPVDHVVRNAAAWDNAGYGLTEFQNTGAMTITDNTAFRNGKAGFGFPTSSSRLTRNLALLNADDVMTHNSDLQSENSWNEPGWSIARLQGTDPATALGPRRPDGSLPLTTFLRAEGIGAAMGLPSS